MIRPDVAFLLIVALCAVWSIHRERRAHDREMHDRRIRHYKGGLLS